MSKLGGVTEEGTVVSNLPLLFADGLPTSLDKITEKQLEKFIVLMLNCSTNREYFCHDKMPTPKWWPNDIPFSIPLVKPPHAGEQWLWKLRSLVTRCYSYHACDFMLSFCQDLATYPVEILKFVDLCDGTTSLLNKENGKLLVTFRNQNVIYDRKVECSPRKCLLPRGGKSCGGSKLMVQPPPFIDIYLCDSCDAEFETLKEVRDHERLCRQEQDQQTQSLRSTTPDDLQCLTKDQSKFLNYFGLSGLDEDASPSTSYASPPRSKAYKRRCQGNLSFIRCSAIPFSSPLGISLQKKMPRATYIVPQGHIDRVERYCLPVKKKLPRISWAHLYRNVQKKVSPMWLHKYSFSKNQRLLKYEALEIGLSERSLHLLKKCLHLKVSLTRLSEQQIAKLTRRTANKSETKLKPRPEVQSVSVVSPMHVEIPVIDLCSSDDEDSGISLCINSSDSMSEQVLSFESASKIEGSCSSQLNYLQNLTLQNPLPIKYSNTSFSVCNLSSKPSSLRKRSRRGRRSLASENEIIPPTREQKKYIRNSFPLEGKSKLQELNQIKESSDTNSKDWYPPFITTSQTKHSGKKFSAAV